METISISELKANLSREIRNIEKIGSLCITDHDHPVALLTNWKSHESIWAGVAEKPMKGVRIQKKISVRTDPLDILSEDRNR